MMLLLPIAAFSGSYMSWYHLILIQFSASIPGLGLLFEIAFNFCLERGFYELFNERDDSNLKFRYIMFLFIFLVVSYFDTAF